MADSQRNAGGERDIEQAITALKKGSPLLKYRRRGKPKFCPFRLSGDGSLLIWYSGKKEKKLKLSKVSKIIPGQRTAKFQRYPRPEKEYQSFSLIYGVKSLDLICKDNDEAEVWLTGLKALIHGGTCQRWRNDAKSESLHSHHPHCGTQRNSPSISPSDLGETNIESISRKRWGKTFSRIISFTEASINPSVSDSATTSSLSSGSVEISNHSHSAPEAIRVSLSSTVSLSSERSSQDFDALSDVFIWGEGIGEGILGGGVHRVESSFLPKMDAFLPKALDSKVCLDAQNIACGDRHAVLVTRQGEIFSWGEEFGGRLGHGVETDISHPKLIDALSGMNIELVACGQYHTCAVTVTGDLYTWGDGMNRHGSEVSHWIPKKVTGLLDGMHVSYISCGPWHTALVASSGQLFTFGDGTFGALGHGDCSITYIPRQVKALQGFRTTNVACGVWHTAAVVMVTEKSSRTEPSAYPPTGMLFTWGDADKGQLGHGDKDSRLIPECVSALGNENICRVACGNNLTVALTTSGKVYTMGSSIYGQLGSSSADGKIPARVRDKIANNFIEDIACGSYHVAVLTSKTEVYTWGKGSNGQLGHGDNNHRNSPTFVEFLKYKQVKNVFCGSNFTAVICLQKWVSSADRLVCSGCQNQFGFRRKRHNCYNCGLVYCSACSSRKSLKASLAPNGRKPFRVCDDCYSKLKNGMDSSSSVQNPKGKSETRIKSNEALEREPEANKLQMTLWRQSSLDSAILPESRLSKVPESNDTHVFPAVNGKLQSVDFHSLKVSNSLVGPLGKVLPNSVPATITASPSKSPISSKSRLHQSSECVLDDSRHMNAMLSQEMMTLRSKVEALTCQSRYLQAELLRTTKQLKEVTEIASDEVKKCKSAKEVINSLSAQLKEMAQLLPEGDLITAGLYIGHAMDVAYKCSNEGRVTDTNSRETELNNAEGRMLPNWTKGHNGKTEWVVQDEPGVYVTLFSLPGGGTELKHVRFSRRHFTKEEADKWWEENGAKVSERHNVIASDGAVCPSSPLECPKKSCS